MDNKTLKMINELEEKGYWVIRASEARKKDMDECIKLDEEGKMKDCCGCSCNICLMQI